MKKTISVKQYQLPVTVTNDGDGYLASCSTWSDCYAQGDTIDEALYEVYSVAASLIELYQEEGKRIPLELELQKKVKPSNKFRIDLPLIISTA